MHSIAYSCQWFLRNQSLVLVKKNSNLLLWLRVYGRYAFMHPIVCLVISNPIIELLALYVGKETSCLRTR